MRLEDTGWPFSIRWGASVLHTASFQQVILACFHILRVLEKMKLQVLLDLQLVVTATRCLHPDSRGREIFWFSGEEDCTVTTKWN